MFVPFACATIGRAPVIRKIFCRQYGNDKRASRFDATLYGSFSVWYGRGRAAGSVQVFEGLLPK